MKFFLPWRETQHVAAFKEKRLMMPRRNFPVEDACIFNGHTPYFSLPNPSGTVRSFLSALGAEDEEEALGFLSAEVSPLADLDQVKALFEKIKEYHFISDEAYHDVRTVSLACGNHEGETEMISLRMVAEPNRYGKWKIYCIEKE